MSTEQRHSILKTHPFIYKIVKYIDKYNDQNQNKQLADLVSKDTSLHFDIRLNKLMIEVKTSMQDSTNINITFAEYDLGQKNPRNYFFFAICEAKAIVEQ